MINIFIALSLALCSFEVFSLTTKISSLNKTMLNIPLSIFSYSVPLVNESGLHYDKTIIENKLNEYFDKNVKKMTNKYTTKYTYYSSTTGSICMSNSCDIIDVSLDANVDGIYNFHRSMKYTIGVSY